MWVWQMPATEGGDVAAIGRRARAAGLRQLWVRVGDSRQGFYGASVLDRLVPAAHRAGMAVLGWGFPTYTGGTLSFIDTVGTAAFVAECDRLAQTHGARFRPSDWLRQRAAAGATFHG